MTSGLIRIVRQIIASLSAMFAILHALGMFVADLFKSRSRLEAENLLLRHQLTIALRQAPTAFDSAAVIALFS